MSPRLRLIVPALLAVAIVGAGVRLTGELGRRLFDDAHARRTRVDLVFTSFGPQGNGIFFGRLPAPSAANPSPGSSATPTIGPLPTEATSPSPSVPVLPPWHRTVD